MYPRKMYAKRLNVLGAFPQWRGGKWQNIEPVVQVFSKPSRGHLCFEVFVGSGHHADIDSNGLA